jgi:hypothetical protein
MRPAGDYSLPLAITIGIRLATGLCKISWVSFSSSFFEDSSFFEEGMYLVFELPQALVYKIQALPDLFTEIFF